MSAREILGHHFILTKQLEIRELKAILTECTHEPTGAKVMHIGNDDPENLFSLSFETLPSNSTGIAHILEHVILCGSRKFPVKDPFSSMIGRSLNTFMNAFTGSDFTCYPAATLVEKDFYNLLEVYLDAVFHPLLKKESVLQEGCRLVFRNLDPSSAQLEWKGIVYNEMKGSLLSPETRLWYAMMKELVPDLTYAHIAGGHPDEIPFLRYEDLVQFHRIHYHPSHCLFFFYGSIPLERHLTFIESKVLKRVANPLPPFPRPRPQKRFTMPVHKEGFYPISVLSEKEHLDNQSMLAISWLTCPIQDQEMVFTLTLLNVILMETDGSLLKLPLLQSGFCSSAEGYLETEMSEVPYLIVCKGCSRKDLKELETLLFNSLLGIVKQGIDKELIEAALYQLELSRMEVAGGRIPFGLTLFMRAALAKQHGCPAEHSLVIHELFDHLRNRLKNPSYLIGVIQEYLIDNPHRVHLDFHANPNLGALEEKEEAEKLEALVNTLSPEDKERIFNEGKALVEYQKKLKNQDINCLPKIELDEVPSLSNDFPLRQKGPILFHPTFTNGLIYLDLNFDLPFIREEDLPYVQLLISILPELGVGKKDYVEHLNYLQSKVGDLSMGASLHVQVNDPMQMRPSLNIHAKALDRQAPALFSILKDFLLKVRFDEVKRMQELIVQIYTKLQSQIQKNGLHFAAHLAFSGLFPSGKIMEQWNGLAYLKCIQSLLPTNGAGFETFDRTIEKLRVLKEVLLSFHNPQLVITCDETTYKQCEQAQFFGILELPQRPFIPWQNVYKLDTVASQAKPISSPIAFTCEAFKVANLMHPHAPLLSIATYLMDNQILYPSIREEGGAYGCGVSYHPLTGSFMLHASRDPHIASTLETFKRAIYSIAEGNFDEANLESAKLEAIQHLDIPVDPGARGRVSYHRSRSGRTFPLRQQYRERLLAASARDVQLAVQKEILDRIPLSKVITFAGTALIARENEKLENPLPINPI